MKLREGFVESRLVVQYAAQLVAALGDESAQLRAFFQSAIAAARGA